MMIKAVGDWELEVNAAPFGSIDSDGQMFDADTDFMLEHFKNPPVVYYHSIEEGKNRLSDNPIVIGQTLSVEKRLDGLWARVKLNKAIDQARKVWEAAKQGLAVASSGTINHLARLDIGGKREPYTKDKPGRIAVWAFGELSLWDMKEGMIPQANPYAVAVPALKAVYKQADIDTPEILNEDNDSGAEPGAEDIGSTEQGPQAAASEAVKSDQTISNEENLDMGEKDTNEVTLAQVSEVAAKAAADAVTAALDAQRKADEERQAAEKEAQEKIDAAVKAAKEEWEKEAAVSNRLPLGGAPHIADYGYDRKYQHLDSSELSFAISTLKAAGKPVSENAYKALALKLNEGKQEHDEVAVTGMKASGYSFDADGIKANEINYSTLASYGDEWVTTANSAALWETIRHESQIVPMIPTIDVPQGAESTKVFLESTDPVFYKVSQVTSDAATGGLSRPAPVVPSSRLGTANTTVTVGEMGARVRWSATIEEDSFIPFANQLRQQMGFAATEYVEHVLIDGDTASTASTNINDIAGTPAGTEAYLLLNGFRKYAIANNSRNGGALTEDDFLDTAVLLGTGGDGADPRRCFFVIGPHVHNAMLKNITAVKTRDVYSNPTIENGRITNLWGYPIYVSYAMGYVFKYSATSIAGYERKFNSAGKIDLDTASNNSTGAIVLVRPDQWRVGRKRNIMVEVDRDIEAQANIIVATMRFGLQYRDTSAAAAISYNVTV